MIFITRNDEIRENAIKAIKSLQGLYDIKITEHKSKRSVQQNSYYWAIIDILSKYTGESKEDMHDIMVLRLLGSEEFMMDGEKYRRPKRTSKLSTKEFSEYLDKVVMATISLELVIPDQRYFGYE